MREGRLHPLLLALCSVCLASPAGAEPAGRDKVADEPAALRANARAEAAWARQRDEDLAARKEFARSLRLPADGEECVAYDPSAEACLVTVEGFNRAVEDAVPPEGQRPDPRAADSARAAVLTRLLDEAYLRSGPMPWRDRDSLEAAYRDASRARVQAFRARLGDSLLHAAYRENFDRLFKGKTAVRVRVLAASDSIWLASAAQTSPPAAWRLIEADDLPPPARGAALALRPGGATGPARLPFGFLCLRYGGRRNVPDTPFEEALPRLIDICSRPESSLPGKEAPPGSGPRERSESAADADPSRLRVWLRPGPASPARSGKDPIGSDTAGLRPSESAERDLPADIRGRLDGLWPLRRGEMLGPMPSPLGIWYFQVLTTAPASQMKVSGPQGAAPSPVPEAESKEADLRMAIRKDYRRLREDPGRFAAWENGLILRFVSLPDP